MLIVDPDVICDREVLPLPDRNFQFPDGHHLKQRRAGWSVRTAMNRAAIVNGKEDGTQDDHLEESSEA